MEGSIEVGGSEKDERGGEGQVKALLQGKGDKLQKKLACDKLTEMELFDLVRFCRCLTHRRGSQNHES